jgi:hypothetical protein
MRAHSCSFAWPHWPRSTPPPFSYMMNLEAANELGLDPEDVRGVLAGIAPIVGTARVASATGNIVAALEVGIEIAELRGQSQNQK